VTTEERTFLHDISSPLTTVMLNLGNALSVLEENNSDDLATCKVLIEKCLHQTKRATDLITARRARLEGEGK